ncbi:MAG TPA: hypothetical protein VGH95_05910 [Candidatus Aquirickettsiella sp.]|jgi:hypothetical protein
MLLSQATVKPNFRESYQEQAEFTPPSYGASISGNFLKQLIEPEIALEKIAPLAGFHPHFSSLNAIYDAIRNVTEISGLPLTQKTGDGIASLLGFSLNPINMVLGGAGGLLVKGTIKGLSALAPEFLSHVAGKTITQLSGETVGSLTEKALTGSSIAATSLLPENLAESITPDNKFDVSHLIQTTSIAGGFGLALSLVPFAAGVIRSKFFKQNANLEETIETIQKNNPDFSIDPVKNQINILLLTPNDLKALQSVIPEELLAREGLNNTEALSRFIQKNAFDRLKKNPDLSEGLKGIINALKNDKDWKPFLSTLIDHLDSGSEPLANTDSVKDYLKQCIENQIPQQELKTQRITTVHNQFNHYQETLKKQEAIMDKEYSTFKKYHEFKRKNSIFHDLIQCLQDK